MVINKCGRGGIRTLGTVSRALLFESSAFNLSATLPYVALYQSLIFWPKKAIISELAQAGMAPSSNG